MFAKTYRVHRIFTRSGSSVCKDKMLQDTQLISLVCALLVLDGLVVTLWVLADPMERHLNNLTLEISSTDRSVVYQPQVNKINMKITIWSILDFLFSGVCVCVFFLRQFDIWVVQARNPWLIMRTLKHSRLQFSFYFSVVCPHFFSAFPHIQEFGPVEQPYRYFNLFTWD